MRLTTTSHERDNAGLTYVYPVVSRRAGGVSVGINLNTNDACNFRCVYCQVPGLVRGKAPVADLALLETELRGFLADAVSGDWMERCVPEGARVLRDVAFSGNGEPTSSEQFPDAVRVVGRVLAEFGLVGKLEVVLITNGSLIHKPPVLAALEELRALNGRVWFKLDSATEEGLRRINDTAIGQERVRKNLALCARACPTWLQTCVFERAGDGGPSAEERSAYLALVDRTREEGLPLEGVLLYGLARPSHQPEAPELTALPAAWLEDFAKEIEAHGLPVRVSV